MSNPSGIVGLGLVCAVLAACGGQAAYSSAPPVDSDGGAAVTPGGGGDALNAELQRVRDATATYVDESRARADGFTASSVGCVSSPLGTVGIPYINAARMEGPLDIDHPAGLLYVPDGDTFRLVGVKYIVPVMRDGAQYTGTAAPTDAPGLRPGLFGQQFYGPVAGDSPGEPWHYELYVWVWQHNPAGPFAPWNASLACQ